MLKEIIDGLLNELTVLRNFAETVSMQRKTSRIEDQYEHEDDTPMLIVMNKNKELKALVEGLTVSLRTERSQNK